MTFYYIIAAVGVLAAIVNFSLGWVHRDKPLHAFIRVVAGIVSLVPPVGFMITKLILNVHLPRGLNGPNLPQYLFITAGLFVGATLMLPAYLERSGEPETGPTLQERAARPANATVRLQKNTDEWIN